MKVGFTYAIVMFVVPIWVLAGGLKSNFAGIRWMGGAFGVVEFLVALQDINRIEIVAHSNTFVCVINVLF